MNSVASPNYGEFDRGPPESPQGETGGPSHFLLAIG